MSGPSRAEITELMQQYRGLLSRAYPGCAPSDVCRFYADVERRVKAETGSPDVALRERGRLLKRWIEDSRGQPLRPFHRKMLAAHYILEQGKDLAAAYKGARNAVTDSEKSSTHWLHGLVPQFKDGALQVA